MIHENNSQKKIIGEIMLAFLPLLAYGIFKNGYLLYQKNLISFYEIFNGLYLILISLGIYFLGNLIWQRKICWDYEILDFYLLPFIIKPNPDLKIFALGVLIGFIILKILSKIKFNYLAFMKLGIMGLFYFLNQYSYANNLESNFHYAFNYFDLLMGRMIGAFATTSIILIFIVFLILVFQKNSKYQIALNGLGAFYLCHISYLAITQNLTWENMLVPDTIFALLFVAPMALASPNMSKGQKIYGLIMGILSWLGMTFINYYAGVYIAILISSLALNFPLKQPNVSKKRKKIVKN